MLAPIALYPDALLSQILMASTYPLEVVEAQRWAQAHPTLSGNAALQAAQQNNWDPSVKSLLAFPRVLQTMGAQLEWTERLGNAFLAQQQQLMDTVQALRRKAYAAGNLLSNAQDQVVVQGDAIRIVPVDPQIAYVPYYDPVVVYGAWWWPAYPPVFWSPWPGYSYVPGFGQGFLWGAGVVVGVDFLFGAFDWEHHRVDVDYDRLRVRFADHFHARPELPPPVGLAVWQHNPEHRAGVPYPLEVRPRFADALKPSEARKAFRGYPAAPAAPVRPPVAAPHAPPRPHAFENIDQGQAVRGFSDRGRNSVHRPAAPSAPVPRDAHGAGRKEWEERRPRP